jgi:hypothetical protein
MLTIGDRVIATQDIWQEVSEDHPLTKLASRGDMLEVRRAGNGNWFAYVAHPEREAKAMFGVTKSEIRKAD